MNGRLILDAVKFGVAQFGLKRGKFTSLAMLLEPRDLPGADWRLSTQRTVRAAVIGKVDEVDRRARRQNCIAAWGFFSNSSTAQEVLIKVGPLASLGDAESRVVSFETRMMSRAQIVRGVSQIRVVRDLELPGVGSIIGFEHVMSAGRAKGRDFKDVVGNVGNILFMITCSGSNQGWAWNDVVTVAASQREKILALRQSD